MKKLFLLFFFFAAFFLSAQEKAVVSVAEKYVLTEMTEKLPAVIEKDFKRTKLSYYCDSVVHYAHRDSSIVIRIESLKVDFSSQPRLTAFGGGEKITVEEFDNNSAFTGGKSLIINEFESGRIVKGVAAYDTLQTVSHYSYSPEGVLQQIKIISKDEMKAVISWTYPDPLTAVSTLVVPGVPEDTIVNRLHFYPSGKIRSNESYDDKGALVNMITYVYDDRNRLIEERAPQSLKTYSYASNDSILRTVKIIGKDTSSCDCTFSGNTRNCIVRDKRINGNLQQTTFNKQGKPVTYVETDAGGDSELERTNYTYTRSGKPLSVVTRYPRDGSKVTYYWQYSKRENAWVERHYVNDYPISVRYVEHRY